MEQALVSSYHVHERARGGILQVGRYCLGFEAASEGMLEERLFFGGYVGRDEARSYQEIYLQQRKVFALRGFGYNWTTNLQVADVCA